MRRSITGWLGEEVDDIGKWEAFGGALLRLLIESPVRRESSILGESARRVQNEGLFRTCFAERILRSLLQEGLENWERLISRGFDMLRNTCIYFCFVLREVSRRNG